jgi:hypothetical protein
MGTAANKIWKDAAVRQASLAGFDAPYVPGWDNHGMPIETQVGREFAEKKVRPERLELRRGCRAYAQKWIDVQREEFKRLGGWGDWERPYLAGSDERIFKNTFRVDHHPCTADDDLKAVFDLQMANNVTDGIQVKLIVMIQDTVNVPYRHPGNIRHKLRDNLIHNSLGLFMKCEVKKSDVMSFLDKAR